MLRVVWQDAHAADAPKRCADVRPCGLPNPASHESGSSRATNSEEYVLFGVRPRESVLGVCFTTHRPTEGENECEYNIVYSVP